MVIENRSFDGLLFPLTGDSDSNSAPQILLLRRSGKFNGDPTLLARPQDRGEINHTEILPENLDPFNLNIPLITVRDDEMSPLNGI